MSDLQRELFGRIFRAFENVKKLGTEKLTSHVIARLQLLDANWMKFQSNHEKLIGALSDKTKSHRTSEDLIEQCEEAYLVNKADLLEAWEKVSGISTNAVSYISPSSGVHARPLPKITLQKFSGEYQVWPAFRDLFLSIIDRKQDISAIEKLYYLKSYVTDEADRYICNYALTLDNYQRTWKALYDHYGNNNNILSRSFVRADTEIRW